MFVWVLKIIIYPILLLFFKPRIYNKQNRNIKGGIIVLSNHKASLDPIFLMAFFPRKIFFMAKKELFEKNFFLKWLITLLGAFPVDRQGKDVTSIKRAFNVIKTGHSLGIFAEGTRIKGNEIGEFEQGSAMIASRMKCPIVPVYIDGNYGLFKRARAIFGEAIYLDKMYKGKLSADESKEASELLRNAVIKLKDELSVKLGGNKRS